MKHSMKKLPRRGNLCNRSIELIVELVEISRRNLFLNLCNHFQMKRKLLVFIFAATFLKSVFIPQFASAQNTRFWATYYGAMPMRLDGDATQGNSIATDAAANVYMAGTTDSYVNIATPGAFQDSLGNLSTSYPFFQGQSNSCGWVQNAYLVKFDASGNRLWGTYYGGPPVYAGDPAPNTYGNNVATDAAGNVYLAGITLDTGLASGGFQDTLSATGTDAVGNPLMSAFLVKFDTNGKRLWATYYGIVIFNSTTSVATDAAGNVYLSGTTSSATGIASGGFQNTLSATGTDAVGDPLTNVFLVKFDASGNRLWATYYGGPYEDYGAGVATDVAGNVYVTGSTFSPTGIASPGAFQDTYDSINIALALTNAFLVKFDGDGNRLWATYYGGAGNAGDNLGRTAATDAAGNVWMAGVTGSEFGIASGGFQDNYVNDPNYILKPTDYFLVKFDANGNRQCATYYGVGTSNSSVALDTAGNVYMAMTTLGPNTQGWGASNSMLVSGGFEDYFGNVTDNALLVKFCPCSKCINLAPDFQASDTTFCGKACINYNGLTNNIVSSQWSFPGGVPSSSIDQNPQGICYDSAGSYNVKLVVTDDRGNRDSLTFINFIKSLAPPPTPVITQHHDTLFCTTDTLYASYQWYDSTTLIPGASDTFLIVSHGGNYNVAVTAPNGCQISVGITIAHDVGINEFSINNLFSLSPNPASDQLTIHTSSHIRGTAIVSIMNVIGEIIQEEKLRWSGDMTINVKTLPAGIYFLQMKTENGIDTKRFVKE